MFRFLLFLFALCAIPAAADTGTLPAVALYYGDDPPKTELKAFDIVVFDPGHVPDPTGFRTAHSEPYAYVAIGEAHSSRPYFGQIPSSARLTTNAEWGSQVIDFTAPQWPGFVAQKIVAPLWEKGYRGFFLDALDSYRLAADYGETAQRAGLVAVIETLHRRFPGIRLILNRGFEIVPQVKDKIQMVAAESLFRGWDARTKRYVEVSEADRAWLLGQLRAIRDDYGLPVLAIDYVPPGDRALSRETAARISALGFVPWVSDAALGTLGIGQREIMPRRIAVLYDAHEAPALNYTNAHRFIEMPINHLGYVADYFDVDRPLPELFPDRFAGVIVWLPGAPHAPGPFTQWILRQIDNGLPVAFFGSMAVAHGPRTLDRLGLTVVPPASGTVSVSAIDPRFRGEAPPLPDRRLLDPLRYTGAGPTLVELTDSNGQRYTGAALTAWGGFVLDPFAVQEIPGLDQTRWMIDPFGFLTAALRLPTMPVPDTTTENGRRLLTVHIDGDGFPSRAELPGAPLAGRVLLDEFVSRYRIPHAVSVIEAEIAPHGLYPADAAEMEKIARRLFCLPHVEIASHTFSHPLRWDNTVRHGTFMNAGTNESYHLDVPGYTFDLTREIAGSVAYIRDRLAPPGKPVDLLFWSGDAAPGADAIRIANAAGLLNINGGETQMTRSYPSLTAVSPLGIRKDGLLQIYAPVTNENLYTNLWTGPFYGFRRVIETFELTGSPRRLKPISLYYHAYSATKKASIAALHDVYRWAFAQPTHPVRISDYIRKVLDFETMTIARDGDGWRVRSNGDLRTVRSPARLGRPDPGRSEGIAGGRPASDGEYYVHLAGDDALLRFSTDAPRPPYLYDANARIYGWESANGAARFSLAGSVPLEFSLVASARCAVTSGGRPLRPRRVSGDIFAFRLDDASAAIEARCRP